VGWSSGSTAGSATRTDKRKASASRTTRSSKSHGRTRPTRTGSTPTWTYTDQSSVPCCGWMAGVRLAVMPRYMIIRSFEVGEDQMPDVGRRSRALTEDDFPEITWEHSHVVVDDNGLVRTYCVYEAPDEDAVRQ